MGHVHSRHAVVTASAVVTLAVLIGACREPTSVRLLLRTNVPESSVVSVEIAVNAADDAEITAPSAFVRGQAWESPQTIGTLTIIPPPSGEGRVTMRAVLAVGRDPGECTVSDASSCVIARRSLVFVPHQTLTVPVVLYLQCEGVACSARETCNAHAMCVSYNIPGGACESAAGCGLPDDPVVGESIPPGRAPTAKDAGNDARTDGSASMNGQATGDGGDSDAGELGEGGQSSAASVTCPSAGMCSGALPLCCFTDAMRGACLARGGTCIGYTFHRECDDSADCAVGLGCCLRGNDIRCAATGTCLSMSGTLLCSPTTAPTDCAAVATSQCSPRTYWSVCGP